jgi:hypothetical protein
LINDRGEGMIAMLPMNGPRLAFRLRRDATGLGPALLGGGAGGGILCALALWSGLGWLAALACYSLGGGLLMLVLALLSLVDARLHLPVLRPAYVRARRRL